MCFLSIFINCRRAPKYSWKNFPPTILISGRRRDQKVLGHEPLPTLICLWQYLCFLSQRYFLKEVTHTRLLIVQTIYIRSFITTLHLNINSIMIKYKYLILYVHKSENHYRLKSEFESQRWKRGSPRLELFKG